MAENQLQVIVRESGLETTKAKYILEKFQDYFEIASDWEKKAKTIKVTNANQTGDIAMAREGRLFLKEKRIAIEKARKDLKEQSLREGKAIDGIANILKGLIVPIEEYLDKQERFVEIEEEKRQEAKRIEIERRIEEERIAEEKKKAEEHERTRLENERLKKEADEREKEIVKERKKQEAKLAKERDEATKKQREIEAKAKIEREKIEAEKKAIEEKARKEREAAKSKIETERKEKESLEAMLKNQVTCPNCGHKFQLNKDK